MGAHSLLPAGSNIAPGGNTRLWDIVFTISATITNTGSVDGDEVPQVYVALGGPNDPKVQLRNFDRMTIAAGQSATFTATLERKDLMNWDTVSQDWYISSYPKTVYVGSSSRKLPLSAQLDMSGCTGSGGSVGNSSSTGSASTTGTLSSTATGSSSPSSPASLSESWSHGSWPHQSWSTHHDPHPWATTTA